MEQIDQPYLDATSNGLSYLISRFIEQPNFCYYQLNGGTRSALAEQAAIQSQAVDAARDAQRIARNQYRAGTTDFTAVATTQASALSSEQSALTIRRNQLTAAVSLIQALGGGWTGQMTDIKTERPPA